MGFNLAVMPIFTRTFPLGHLKGYMLGGNLKMLWQVRKELEKGGLRGPEGDKGAKGGLFMNHYDLLVIRHVSHIAQYLTKPT